MSSSKVSLLKSFLLLLILIIQRRLAKLMIKICIGVTQTMMGFVIAVVTLVILLLIACISCYNLSRSRFTIPNHHPITAISGEGQSCIYILWLQLQLLWSELRCWPTSYMNWFDWVEVLDYLDWIEVFGNILPSSLVSLDSAGLHQTPLEFTGVQ